MNKDKLINEAVINNLSVKQFHQLLINKYNFNVLDALELSTLYKNRLNK